MLRKLKGVCRKAQYSHLLLDKNWNAFVVRANDSSASFPLPAEP